MRAPINGTVMNALGSRIVTYTAGARKGPDSFAYTVSDGEFTTPPTIVVVSVVAPHWLSPSGGSPPTVSGSRSRHARGAPPAHALAATSADNRHHPSFFL